MKTGGTSVSKLLRDFYPAAATYPSEDDPNAASTKVSVAKLLAHRTEATQAPSLYPVHMPAWVAEHSAPSHLRATVLREPVERTLSHLRHIARALDTDDIEAIYDDPAWRDRLSNYQVRLLSATPQQHFQRQEALAQALREALDSGSASPREPGERPWAGPARHIAYTAIAEGGPLDQHDLDRAIERLGRFELVGSTDRLDAFTRKLGDLLELPLKAAPRLNTSSGGEAPSAALLARIRADNALDAVFYERALSLSH